MTRGHLLEVEAGTRRAIRAFGAQDHELSWKFRLLGAKTEVLQGKSLYALALLSRPLPDGLADGDIEVEREMLLALANSRLGRADRALDCLAKAQNLAERTHSRLESELLSYRGIVLLQNNDAIGAESMFRQALEQVRREGDKYLESNMLLNLGVVELQTERYDKALSWLQDASQLAKSIDAQLVLEKAQANTGWAYYGLGDFEKGLSNFQQAEKQSEKLGAQFDQVGWLANEGLAHYYLGELNEAETSYRRSLALAKAIQNHQEILDGHLNLGFLLLQMGDLQGAQEMCVEALQLANSVGSRAIEADPLFLEALLAQKSGDRKQAERNLIQVENDSSGVPSLRWKVEDALGRLHADAGELAEADIWFQKAISTFETQRSSIKSDEAKLPFFTNASQVYGDYAEYLVNHGRAVEALKLIDLGRARTLAEGLGIAPKESRSLLGDELDPQAVARKLNGTILTYWLGPRESYLWAISSTQIRLFKLPKEAEISALARSYQRAVLNSVDTSGTENEAGIHLYDTLVAPAQEMLPKGSRVFVIPDGSLGELNFESLLVSRPTLHYWIEDAVVISADSVRMLDSFASRPRVSTAGNLLLIGDPVPSGGPFEELPNASKEADTIQKHFHPDRKLVLTRERALPSAYADSHPERYAYIHFVAHATASRLNPLESAVILSGSPDEPGKFKLYARDVMRYPLHAQLVTVSACNGSGTRSYAGEGLVGLSWAFLRAGSHYVAAALWEVDDASTPQMMDTLYGAVERGASPDAAMREAKLSLVHSRGTFRKPLYWASFQMYAGS